MRRVFVSMLLLIMVIVSCAKQAAQLPTIDELSARSAAGTQVVTVFKAPT